MAASDRLSDFWNTSQTEFFAQISLAIDALTSRQMLRALQEPIESVHGIRPLSMNGPDYHAKRLALYSSPFILKGRLEGDGWKRICKDTSPTVYPTTLPRLRRPAHWAHLNKVSEDVGAEAVVDLHLDNYPLWLITAPVARLPVGPATSDECMRR